MAEMSSYNKETMALKVSNIYSVAFTENICPEWYKAFEPLGGT